MRKKEKILIILGIIFISFNLRAPITAVGSVANLISEEFNLTRGMAGFITTLPLIAFAVVSPFVSNISKKLGYGKTMLFGLILMMLGEIVRSYTGVYGLFIGTALLGIGIAIGNVLIPSIIKLKFGKNIGKMTSIYTSSMCIFAAVGAGFSMPLAAGFDLGWKNALAVWFIFTLFTLVIWMPQLKQEKTDEKKDRVLTSASASSTSIWTSKTAWFVTTFMGIQSLLFYSMVAWLPTIIVSKGMDPSFASEMALTYQLVAIPATLLIPVLCDKFKNQRCLVMATCSTYLIGMVLFLTGTSPSVLVLSVLLMSLGMGGSISLSIAFISLRSPNPQKASELSGMAQSAGYLLAAIGPTLMGTIYDFTYSWSVPIMIFIGLIILLSFIGLQAGNDITVPE